MDIVSYGKDFKKVYAVDGFAKEFQQLFDHASLKRYTDWLWRNLQNLERHGKRAVDKTHIEKLHDTDCNLYSIRSARSKSNPRVIFIFTEEDDEIGRAHV